jgi:hypothetical protein
VVDWNLKDVKALVKQYSDISNKTYIDKEVQLLNKLSNSLIDTPSGQLNEVFLGYFELLTETEAFGFDSQLAIQKAILLENLIESHSKRDRILEEMGKSDPITLASTLYGMDAEMLSAALETHFS